MKIREDTFFTFGIILIAFGIVGLILEYFAMSLFLIAGVIFLVTSITLSKEDG